LEEIIKAVIEEAGYPGGFIIKNISFSLDRGEILLITGRSGSGKTTLLKTILQLIHLDNGFIKGKIIFRGRRINEYTPQTLYREIAYIPQEPWYGILGYTVWLEYCLSLNQSGLKCRIDRLDRYGLKHIIDRTTYNLSAGEYQRLLWASALDRRVSLLVVDEPFVYLDRESRDTFYKLLNEYIDRGGSVIVVDHEYERWRSLRPKTLLLENGTMKYY
jgi:energy-coupling factor transporter ATP-binding protein EcfA2